MLRLDSSKQNIWFSADLHYWHKNICKADSVWNNPNENCRDFPSTKEMSRHLVEQINKYVGQDDIFIFLGDWSFGGMENIWNFRKQIICKNIYFVLGNHDSHIRNNKILPNCKYTYQSNTIDWEDTILDGAPKTQADCVVSAKDLFTEVSEVMRLIIDNVEIVSSHYPYEDWREQIHLHGHTHSKLPIKENRLDVGIDNAFKLFGEYKPFSWKEVKRILKVK